MSLGMIIDILNDMEITSEELKEFLKLKLTAGSEFMVYLKTDIPTGLHEFHRTVDTLYDSPETIQIKICRCGFPSYVDTKRNEITEKIKNEIDSMTDIGIKAHRMEVRLAVKQKMIQLILNT